MRSAADCRLLARAWLAAGLLACACCGRTLRAADPNVGVRLPADHAAHGDAQTEWWHFHGHLVDETGAHYDFFLGFVKQHTTRDTVAFIPVRWFVDPFQVAYFTITDRARGRFHFREKHNFPDTWAAGARRDRLALRHDSWRAVARDDGTIELRAATRTDKLKLTIRAAKPAALLGKNGYLYVPPSSSHYYYSVPRMTAEGTLRIGGKKHTVHGAAWLKHEWGFLYTPDLAGWVWFGVQLSSGKELEIGLIYDRDWNLAEGAFAVVEEKDGSVTRIPIRSLAVKQSGATWRSPRTDTVYPTGWILEIPKRGMLVMDAVNPGQEMEVFPANLWAGALTVQGVFDDEAVSGDCFAEVVGIDEPFGRGLFRSGAPRARR